MAICGGWYVDLDRRLLLICDDNGCWESCDCWEFVVVVVLVSSSSLNCSDVRLLGCGWLFESRFGNGCPIRSFDEIGDVVNRCSCPWDCCDESKVLDVLDD